MQDPPEGSFNYVGLRYNFLRGALSLTLNGERFTLACRILTDWYGGLAELALAAHVISVRSPLPVIHRAARGEPAKPEHFAA